LLECTSVKLAIHKQRDKPAGSTLLDWVVAGVADRRVDGAEHAAHFASEIERFFYR
jgi:hypothetical protein